MPLFATRLAAYLGGNSPLVLHNDMYRHYVVWCWGPLPLSTSLNPLYSLIGVGVSGPPLSADRGWRPLQAASSVMSLSYRNYKSWIDRAISRTWGVVELLFWIPLFCLRFILNGHWKIRVVLMPTLPSPVTAKSASWQLSVLSVLSDAYKCLPISTGVAEAQRQSHDGSWSG